MLLMSNRLRLAAERARRYQRASLDELYSMEEGRVSANMVRNNRLAAMMSPLALRLSLTNRDFNANDYDALLALDEQNTISRGAEQVQINRLPAYKVTQSSKAAPCSVCLDDLSPGEDARIMPCLHQFHKDCIDKWLMEKTECPVCKVNPFQYVGDGVSSTFTN
mmetsp:Transcript_42576/g.66697  ORF Transcript_42576/g.66697 Transcript_42576/m.66697 type:complete len:164 (-) Transcript_42576:354-845(-)